MLSLTSEAVAYIRSRGKPIYLDIPPFISGDFNIQESPAVRFGEPRDPKNYALQVIQGVSVYVPYRLPEQALTISLASFFGWRRLVVQGWHLA